MSEARDVYEKGMDTECGPKKSAVSPGDLQDLHGKYLAAGKTAFANKRTMATQKEINKCLDKLNTVMTFLIWFALFSLIYKYSNA